MMFLDAPYGGSPLVPLILDSHPLIGKYGASFALGMMKDNDIIGNWRLNKEMMFMRSNVTAAFRFDWYESILDG